MDGLLEGAEELKAQLGKHFEVLEETSSNFVLFRIVEGNIPMAYFVSKFGSQENSGQDRVRLIATEHNGEQYFRIVVVDPNFKTHCAEFVDKIVADAEYYASMFEGEVRKRYDNLISITEECGERDDLLVLYTNVSTQGPN